MRTVDLRLAAGSGAVPMLLAVLLAGLLTGCGETPEPQPLPKPTTSTSPSAPASSSAVPSAPVIPAAAKAKNRAGAEALVDHFLLSLNYSGGTGNTNVLRKTYVALCTRCEALADAIDQTYADGGSYRGGDWIRRLITFYKIESDVAVLDANVDYTAQTWVKAEGATPTRFPASNNHLHAFQLKWSKDLGWRVGALDPQQ